MRHISQVTVDSAPVIQHTAPKAADGRAARRASNLARRAARRHGNGPDDTLWVALPARRDAHLQSIVESRRRTWRRRCDALTAVQTGNRAEARAALHELLTDEAAIQCEVDSVQVSGRWASVAGELWRASYAAKKAIRDQLADLDLYPVGACPTEPMNRLVAAHSDWLHAWRTFVQVIPTPANS